MTLRQWLSMEGVRGIWPIYAVAAHLGRSRSQVSTYVNGHIVPKPRDVVAIWRLTGGAVGPEDWYPDIVRERSETAETGQIPNRMQNGAALVRA